MGFIRKRSWPIFGKYGRRKRLYLSLLASSTLALMLCWRLSTVSIPALLPPWTDHTQRDLEHFRRSRDLEHYLDNINLLIDPSSQPCANLEEVRVVALVTSSPSHHEQRHAIRNTWGKHQPTYFIMGLHDESKADEQLIDNYMEAKQHDDLVVYDYRDHYQNLTIKTALMLQWSQRRCPHAKFLLKVDDDVLVNPWVLKQVLKKNEDSKLIGYVHKERPVYRQRNCKWYVPRWLHSEDVVPGFLAGPSYIVNGDSIRTILTAAYKVPMINVEDVYFTHLVASSLGYHLTHDDRLAPKRPWPPWLPFSCAYWQQGTIHSLTPSEIEWLWAKIRTLGALYEKDTNVCDGELTRLGLRFVYLY